MSVSCNTPKSFENVKILTYITLVIDVLTGSVLTIDASMRACSCIKVYVVCSYVFLFVVSSYFSTIRTTDYYDKAIMCLNNNEHP